MGVVFWFRDRVGLLLILIHVLYIINILFLKLLISWLFLRFTPLSHFILLFVIFLFITLFSTSFRRCRNILRIWQKWAFTLFPFIFQSLHSLMNLLYHRLSINLINAIIKAHIKKLVIHIFNLFNNIVSQSLLILPIFIPQLINN